MKREYVNIALLLILILFVFIAQNFSYADSTDFESRNSTESYIEFSSETESEMSECENFFDVSYLNSDMKTYMDYRCIKNRKSKQYELQQMAYTDELGFRKVGECYLVALGSAFGTEIGKEYEVELESGKKILVMLGDCKSDMHTDASCMYVEKNRNIVEFIVDTEKIEKMSRICGDMSYSGLEGKVVSIREISC